MITEFDEKGKIFTNVIAKRPILAVIHTATHRIHGKIHVTPNERLKDELNQSEQFIAITDATVMDHQDNVLFRCNFLTINRNFIIWLIPEEALIIPGEQN